MHMKATAKKASSLASALLAASALSGCAKDLHPAARVPTLGAVDSLPGSPFNGSKSISSDETITEEQVFAGRQNLEEKAHAMEMKSIEHKMRRYALLCSADYERRTHFLNLRTDEVTDLKAACEAEAAELGLREAARALRAHGDNMHELERQKKREEREEILWNENLEMRRDNHGMRLQEREAAIEERALRAREMLEIQKAHLARIEDERQLRREYVEAYRDMLRERFDRAAQPQPPPVVVVQPPAPAASCPLPAAKNATTPATRGAKPATPPSPCVEPKKP